MTEKKNTSDLPEEQSLGEPENPQEADSAKAELDSETPEKLPFYKNPTFLRLGLLVVTILAGLLIIWGIGALIANGSRASAETLPTPTKVEPVALNNTPAFTTEHQDEGVVRLPEVVFTPVSPTPEVEKRTEVTTYTVQEGDTIFGIAEKFSLKPETVLWSNRYTLGDTPDGIYPGINLYILPVDGVYHMWSEGEGLNGVSSFYGVTPDDIVNYPGNNLDPATLGSYSLPNITPGTMLVVPDGTRPTVTWVAARDEAVSGNSYLGEGACGGIIYGNVGTGTFTWPTTAHYLSGYDYTPPTHNGLDFDGDFGSPIYAADSGVIVYSGWSDRGYGNLIVVDHDDGWQTFYAHLMDGTLLPCGSNVQKGQLIASMGSTGKSTGPHLHFELRSSGYPVNPWLYLQ